MKVEAAIMGEDFRDAPNVAEQLERQGLDCGIIFEGPHDPFFPVLLSSQKTTQLELATGVAIAFARNPMICAGIAHDLQAYTNGRFILGLGSQIKPHIEKRFSMPWSKPAARMRDFVLAIRAIWNTWETNERLEFRGEFYTHTLMTPVFNPGPHPNGLPPIFTAGVGPKMIEVAGEVSDGIYIHPLNTPAFLEDIVMPALERGFVSSNRKREDFQVSVQTLVMMGSNDEEITAARNKAKGQLSFYGSTPAYNVVLEHNGWGHIHPELNRLSKQGKWFEMMGLITDDMLDAIGISGTPDEVGAMLRKRNAPFADRTMLTMYNETGDPEAVVDVVRGIKNGDST